LRLSWSQTKAALPITVIASTSREVQFEIPSHITIPELEEEDDDDEDDFAEKVVQAFGGENLCHISSLFIVPFSTTSVFSIHNTLFAKLAGCL